MTLPKLPKFAKDLLERAGKSFVQGFAVGAGILTLGVEATSSVQIIGFPWAAALSTGGGMAVASVVTSVLSYKVADTGTASAVKLEQPPAS